MPVASIEPVVAMLSSTQQIGDLRGQTTLLHNLGAVAQNQGRFSRAEDCLQSGLAIAPKINLQEMVSLTFSSLGETALEQGNLDIAKSYLQQAVTIARDIFHVIGYKARIFINFQL